VKILQVVPYFPPAYAFGGPGTIVYEVSKELARRGHEVTVYTTDAKDLNYRLGITSPHFQDGVKICYFRNISMKLVKKMKLFFTPELFSKATRKNTFDVMHLHEYRTLQDITAYRMAKKSHIPYVFQVHGSLPIMLNKKKLKRIYDLLFGYKLLNDSARVIALTTREFQDYRNMNVPEGKIEVIPDGLNPSPFLNLNPSLFRNTFNIPDECKILLFMGRIHKIKGLDYLIYAFSKLSIDSDNVVLVVCGSDDGFLSEAKRMVESYGISGRVRFLGLVRGVTKLSAYAAASIVICPSMYGAFDLVPIEAAFCGKPLIASNSVNYGLSQLIREGNFGFLVNPRNSDELKNAISVLLKNQRLASELGSNGRAYAFNNLTIEKMVDKLEKLYFEIS
jgi:glycosyltransferase involved in cell wall biosynthesis